MKKKTAKSEPRSVQLMNKGFKTTRDVKLLLDAVMSDVAAGRISPRRGNEMSAKAFAALNDHLGAELRRIYES